MENECVLNEEDGKIGYIQRWLEINNIEDPSYSELSEAEEAYNKHSVDERGAAKLFQIHNALEMCCEENGAVFWNWDKKDVGDLLNEFKEIILNV